jgi:integrase
MRVYRTYYKDKDGEKKQVKKWYIETRDHLNIIRRFPALTDKRQSEALGRQIDKLANSKVAGEQPDAELTRWLECIPEKLRSKLAKIGLLDSKRAAAGKPLSMHLNDFRQSLIAKNLTKQHIGQLTRHVEIVFEGCKFLSWSDISASRVEWFIAELRQKHGLGAQTANYHLKHTKQFCKWMVQDRRASESPLVHLSTLVTTEKRHERRALEPDEIRRLLSATRKASKRFCLTGHERAMLYRLAIETGLRRNEIRSLTVSSFDFDACTVVVEAQCTKNKKRAELPLRPDTAKEIKIFTALKTPDAKLFNKITNRTSEMIQEDLAEANIPYVDDSGRYCDFHSLRHTTGSLLASSGIHPKIAQSIMRHADINLTMSRYTHVFRGQETEAVAKLPDLSIPPKEQQAYKTGTDECPVDGVSENLAQILPNSDTQQYITMDFSGQTNPDTNQEAGFLASEPPIQNGKIPLTGLCDNSLSTGKQKSYESKQNNLAQNLAFSLQKDPALASLHKSWPELPEHIKQAIMALVNSQG